MHRSAGGVITRIEKKTEYVYHYSFHIMDPAWGHMVIKMSGHPPWPAQVILNGHEYVAVAAQGEGIGFVKEGNCFTGIADPQGLARVADALSQHAAVGRLGQACNRWIYTACLCFGLDLAEQERSGFRYGYSVYQAEYSRNLLFRSGGQMEDLFDRVLDRTRSRLDIPMLRTIFGLKNRPHQNRAAGPPAQEVVIEKPQYGLAWFRIRFGMLQLKAYTKGEHVLRFEATCHNAKELRCRRGLDNFREIITRLAGMADRFATTLDCVDISFLADGLLDELPTAPQIGAVRIGGIDLNKPRIARRPGSGTRPGPGTARVHRRRVRRQGLPDDRHDGYTIRQAAYDLRKLRGKNLIDKPGRTRRYQVPPSAARTIAALLTLRDHVIAPILAGVRSPRPGRKPAHWTRIDADYQTLRTGMQALFDDLGITRSQPPHRQHFVDQRIQAPRAADRPRRRSACPDPPA